MVLSSLSTAGLVCTILVVIADGVCCQQSDADILNFALNLEYLEAEFYSWAAFGVGLPAYLRGNGPASVGGKKARLSSQMQGYAEEIAIDEIKHVQLLRNALGANAVPMPAIDIGRAFAVAAEAAFNSTDLVPDFDPYGSDVLFLHGAFLFEDVGVSAYRGAAPLIKDPAILSVAAGLLGTEAYHAGAIRALASKIVGETVFPYGVTVGQIFQAISDLRDAIDGYNQTDQGLLYDAATGGLPAQRQFNITNFFNSTTQVQNANVYDRFINLTPADDVTALPFARNGDQVLAIVYGGSATTCGLFFPNCVNTMGTYTAMAPSAMSSAG